MTPSPSARHRPARTGRWILRHRRFLAALFLSLSVSIAVYQLTPAPADDQSLVTAAVELPAGATLSRADLQTAAVPGRSVPAGSFRDPGTLVGRQLATPLRKGQFLSDSSLLGPGLLGGTDPGTTAVPVRLADPQTLKILTPGQLVDVVVNPEREPGQARSPSVIATRVAILWVAREGKDSVWPGAGNPDGLLVLAASEKQSRAIAEATGQGRLSVVLVR
ncbi:MULTISPECIES: Flp pilus assembly protein CpaB [Arthrobacter]|uniref:Flp pilus assembly protein CpaB n=2 Tax=Arthrobacter TaxID=1663 RepID=A0ABU9KM84_9MICC|nr:Flp pilus assembly protein CpaB [Arthrobacter sp. YJM1]MDP5227066.1 Flp pilus assembly protein CpaB [Arthrobacter sp. YJM1]